MFPGMYKPCPEEKSAFGEHWCGPKDYEQWGHDLVAEYRKYAGGDGQNTKVYCCAAPARFYEVVAEAGEDSVGKQKAGYTVSTGSGQDELAANIAEAIASGNLTFYPQEEK